MIITTSSQIIGKKIEMQFDEIEAFAFYGTGFFTSICIAFASFFGVQSKSYANKMKLALEKAKDELCQKAIEYKYDAIIDFKIVHLGNAVCVYGTPIRFEFNSRAYINNNAKINTINYNQPLESIPKEKSEGIIKCPNCGSIQSKDYTFCWKCGEINITKYFH